MQSAEPTNLDRKSGVWGTRRFVVEPAFRRLKSLRKKSEDEWKCVPQRLKPYLFSIVYVRAEARTLQRTEFCRSL